MNANESGNDVVVELPGVKGNPGVGEGTVETPPPPDDDLTLEEAFVIAALLA